MINNLFSLFYSAYKRNPNGVCISFPDKEYTYNDVFIASSKLSQLIRNDNCKYIGILGHRSLSAYVGILATLQTGKTYVPLNPKFPTNKLNQILLAASIQTIVTDNESLIKIKDLHTQRPVIVLAPEFHVNGDKQQQLINGIILDSDVIGERELSYEIADTQQGKAYLLFTSGSTGDPKGIEIGHQNVIDYLYHTQQRLQLNSNDKCSQIFDLSFDLSVHDLFLTWMNGAALCVPERSLFNPVSFVNNNSLTVWFSVPSVGYSLLNNKFLEPNLFPTLRLSLFCGEPLITSFITEWQIASPNSEIENIYGPTECTIGISSYLWKKDGNNKTRNGIVSIGKVFPNQKYLIVDDEDFFSGVESTGELLLSGSQVISQYYTDVYNASDKFYKVPGSDQSTYYRTGDIVYEDEDGFLYFMQRKDYEFKIRGYRVEENEINNVISRITNISNVISLPFCRNSQLPEGIVSFILTSEPIDEVKIIRECKQLLPDYMVPNKIYAIDKLPLNCNGKIDRTQLLSFIDSKK
jgi:D-alanine--poly(phosphoribitol) ligase subunit 1